MATDSSGEQIIGEGNGDIAVLKIKIDRYEEPFTTGEYRATYFVELGDSSRVPDDTSISIFGYPREVQALIRTRGDVTGREMDADWTWIITDADVEPGNSGGAAVNEDGYLIGIPTEVNCRVTDEEVNCPVTEGATVKILPINAAKPLLARAGFEAAPLPSPLIRPRSPSLRPPRRSRRPPRHFAQPTRRFPRRIAFPPDRDPDYPNPHAGAADRDPGSP